MRGQRILPTQTEEQRLWSAGFGRVAGVDEVGRGPLAGPVVAAAVVLPDLARHPHDDLALVRDSKSLSPSQRERGAKLVRSMALAIGVGAVDAEEIDRVGIVPATKLAMRRALDALDGPPADVASSWLAQARARLAADNTLAALDARAIAAMATAAKGGG